jgi:hypothetical protein
MSFMGHILQQPLWIRVWVGWMVVVNTACLAFLRHSVGRWVLVAWVGNMVTMQALFAANGYNRLLGLSHVLWWTPLLTYLLGQRRRLASGSAVSRWVAALAATIALSLVLDYLDVARYLLGDRR